MTDDTGFGVSSTFGGVIPTPTLDRIAADGHRNATIIEQDGQCAGCLIGYEIPDNPDPIPDDLPSMFVPLQELENQAPGTWYINVLAVRPQFPVRGSGRSYLLWRKKGHTGSESEVSASSSPTPTWARIGLQAAGLQRASAEADGQRQLAERRMELGPADENL